MAFPTREFHDTDGLTFNPLQVHPQRPTTADPTSARRESDEAAIQPRRRYLSYARRRNKRIAREWLFLLGCFTVSSMLCTSAAVTRQPHSFDLLGPLMLAAYVGAAVIRITVWAIRTVRESD